MSKRQIEVSILKDMSELSRAFEIRRQVFVVEYGCTDDDEFDGNDFSATHLIARVDGMPAGTMRIRYFGDMIILERLAVLPEYRKARYGERGVAFALAAFGIDLCRMKGFKRWAGYAVAGSESFWEKLLSRFGEVEGRDDEPIECSGSQCITLHGSLHPVPGAIRSAHDYHAVTAYEGDLPAMMARRAQEAMEEQQAA